jgi:hypothetical protein
MSKTLDSSKQQVERYFVIGSRGRFRGPVPEKVSIWKSSNLRSFPPSGKGRAVFVSCAGDSTDALLKARLGVHPGRRFDQLLMMEPPRIASIQALFGLFKEVIGFQGCRWLPLEELVKVISGADAANRFIGGAVDAESKTLALVRGDGQTVVVPFSLFEPTADGVKPDFSKLAFTDYGHTVQLGEYEASTDAILYETDEAYRRKLNKDRLKSDRSFGASLRRLRIQKRLKRSDFPNLAAKTIARIERNEIDRPQGRTLEIIAQRLGVAADQIETY